jgi:hypothetical protein
MFYSSLYKTPQLFVSGTRSGDHSFLVHAAATAQVAPGFFQSEPVERLEEKKYYHCYFFWSVTSPL